MGDTSTNPRPSSPSELSESVRGRSSFGRSPDRAVLNARLASPVPAGSLHGRTTSETEALQNDNPTTNNGTQSPVVESSSSLGIGLPGASALANALRATLGRRSSQQSFSAVETGDNDRLAPLPEPPTNTNYGSLGPNSARSRHLSGTQSPAPLEDFDVVRKHLAGPSNPSPSLVEGTGSAARSPQRKAGVTIADGPPEEASDLPSEEFSSLRLQGGDIHRQIYRRTEAEESAKNGRLQRSQSVTVPKLDPEDPEMDIENIKQPGGFRRNHLLRNTLNSTNGQRDGSLTGASTPIGGQPNFVTRNFYEFLSLYGHFAGEEVDEDDEYDSDQWGSTRGDDNDDDDDYNNNSQRSGRATERSPLLKRRRTRLQKQRDNAPKKGAMGTVFILLKSFVGTGVLFLPKAFLNGGILFSGATLFLIACISYYCFILLTTSRLALKGSYPEMGNIVHGPWLRFLINTSLVLSQMGFASAYIVFTSENLQAFILAVSHNKTFIDIKLMILMQLIIFLPLSLYRNLNNISYVVYIADIFIVLGLVYLYYYDIATIVAQHGVADVVLFNKKSWTLFIGTAIFTFEGIGLLIPIQDGMKKPQQLPSVLGLVMLIIATIFISMGALSYAAYGSKTKTVIILNMPQDNKFVNGVQFLYSLAILLSTPMQIFPAITIMEKGVFTKSGKFSREIKWRKNGFRFGVVMLTALVAWVGADDLDRFVALVGCFACIPLVYIYPPLIHRKAVADAGWKRVMDIVLVVLGFILMAYTTVLTIASWIR